MSKKGYTHIITILDRSGSMNSIRDDMQGGFNDFVKNQKDVDGEATMTLAQFDSEYEVVYNDTDIAEVPELVLQPRGATALLDAMGRTLTTERDRIKDMEEDDQPEKIICVIITDGQENASREYNRKRIFDMIKNLEDEEDPQWDFVFLGANQDAIAEGGSLGMRAASTMTYDASSDGTRCAFMSLSKSVSDYRGATKGKRYAFSDKDREDQEELLKKSAKKFGKAIPSCITDLSTTVTTE